MKSPKLMLILGMAVVSGVSQTQPAQKPSFDVVSVKPNKSGGPPRRIGTEGNRFIAENVPLILLIQLAYGFGATRLAREHVIGGPPWINTERFDIETRVDISTRSIPTQRTWFMVQTLLEDRFKLKVPKVHSEVRQLPVYDLVVARDGMKMKRSDDQTAPNFDDIPDEPSDASVHPRRGEAFTTRSTSGEIVITASAIGISPNLSTRRAHSLLPHGLTTLLSANVGRPVIDKTNLNGISIFGSNSCQIAY